METTTLGNGQVLTHHPKGACFDPPCPIHSPTDHAYSKYPLGWDSQARVMTRITPDGEVFDPDDFKVRSGMTIIIQNKLECLECGDHIESTHRHDFQSCHCGMIFVDGGREYLRHGGNPHFINDLSITWRNKNVQA